MAMQMPMQFPFGLIVGGRPLLTNPETIQPDPSVPPRSFVFRFPAAPTFSHITVFMNPQVPLPNDAAVSVYISLPSPQQQQQQQQQYTFMGALTNEKPSAVYKVNIPSTANTSQLEQQQEDLMMDVDADQNLPVLSPDAVIEIGLQLDPASEVAQRVTVLEQQRAARRAQIEAAKSSGQGSENVGKGALKGVGLKIAQNLFNYLSGFAVRDVSGKDVVPMDAFRRWWDKFQVRVENDPEYLVRGTE
ncbi:hypothetical protein KEM56_000345 [Ascosphaera pollenicola]|nr:hypothetical protein KEM56_000345 [Ascosphaera pollenicola]